jgi:hypothetical protein
MKDYLGTIQPKVPVDNYTKPQVQQQDLGLAPAPGTPKPTLINPNVKDTGAPVAFTPRSAQMVNGVFGNAIDNSFDRTMGPISTTQGQSM